MPEPEPERPGPFKERNGSTVLATDTQEEIRRHIKDLLSEDYTVRAASIGELGKYGQMAAEALVDALMKKPEHPHVVANFSDALAEIGKPSLNVILHAFSHFVEVKRPRDIYLLESFVDLLGVLHDRRAVAPLLEQLARLNQAAAGSPDRQFQLCCESAKIRIHRLLADLGDKGGLEDLLTMLGDGRKRVRDGVVEALTRAGDQRALVPLLRLYDIEEHVSCSGAQFIKEAIREIVRREHVTAEDRLFKDLTPEEKNTLERVLPRAKNGKH
jgi:HEAT repeat protein